MHLAQQCAGRTHIHLRIGIAGRTGLWLGILGRCRRRKKNRPASAASAARPPTTPPAIAPVRLLDPGGDGVPVSDSASSDGVPLPSPEGVPLPLALLVSFCLGRMMLVSSSAPRQPPSGRSFVAPPLGLPYSSANPKRRWPGKGDEGG